MTWFIIIILFCLGNSQAQFLNVSNSSDSELHKSLLSLLLILHQQKLYDILLIYGEDCPFPALSRRLPVSTVLASSGSTDFDWNYSSLTLILSCGFEAEKEENYRTLMKLQTNRRLILLQEDIQPESVCNFYSKKEQYNIAMVKENFPQSGLVYSCRLFQDQNYEEINISTGKSIFIKQFRNMQGAPIRTLTDKLAPRSMAYRDSKSGKVKYIGFVANVLNLFVEKVNATMIMQLKLIKGKEIISFMNISKWASEDMLDIGMSNGAYYKETNFDILSYPYLMSSHCFMAPLPDLMPYSEIYVAIVNPSVLIAIFALFFIFSVMVIYLKEKTWRNLSLISVLMNDICLRGFLAQTFPYPRQSNRKMNLILMLICFSSLIITTMYSAYLQTFMWGPPVDPFMTSFADLEKSRYKVAITSIELQELLPMNVSMENVLVLEDAKKFIQLRDSFNDDYIYPVTALSWIIFKEQQKRFTYPLFYYSEALCLNSIGFFSFPVRRHLPYRDLFEEHMLRQNEFGLTNYWFYRGFLDMLKLNLATSEDLSPPHLDDYIEVDDLYWVFGMYFAGLGISLCCFILEILGSLSYWRRLRIYKWLWAKN
ncbi:uncharacterized protein LOC108112082 [Drosophila eugracilis]|uniref:uncharacterized protein LOC108112082 n=1 Tax=Drosophila eugracilis TaxID=29029 RepID=UPI0007E5C1CA|nr:uncharacterized protein LOC108112082 [Drosophila eugracilis]